MSMTKKHQEVGRLILTAMSDLQLGTKPLLDFIADGGAWEDAAGVRSSSHLEAKVVVKLNQPKCSPKELDIKRILEEKLQPDDADIITRILWAIRKHYKDKGQDDKGQKIARAITLAMLPAAESVTAPKRVPNEVRIALH
jgi:hypothetical protein